MSELPAGLQRERHAELQRRGHEPWARRVLLAVLTVGVASALLGAIGQRAHTSQTTSPSATFDVRMPTVVRGGLLFQVRFRITAIRTIEHPRLILDNGFFDGLQVNTLEPSPDSESSSGDHVIIAYDQPLRAGRSFTVFAQFQVDPTSVGRSTNGVSLADGSTVLAHIDRSLRRLP